MVLANVPTEHSVQFTVLVDGVALPAAHCSQLDAPLADACHPAGHDVHVALPRSEYDPARQGRHSSAPSPSA